jgi:antitoxin component of MazEF toxin-antitoxin module
LLPEDNKMSRERISTSGEDATVRLPGEILEGLGLAVGDEVEMFLERTLVVRPLSEAERADKIDAITNDVIERRTSAYEELTRGAD